MEAKFKIGDKVRVVMPDPSIDIGEREFASLFKGRISIIIDINYETYDQISTPFYKYTLDIEPAFFVSEKMLVINKPRKHHWPEWM